MLTDAKEESKIHIGPLPGRRMEIYYLREVYVIFHVLSVPIQEQRADLLFNLTWRQRWWGPAARPASSIISENQSQRFFWRVGVNIFLSGHSPFPQKKFFLKE